MQHKQRNPKRTPGTCEWFLEHLKYRNWQSAKSSSFLWVSADAGCGKSMLASFLVDTLSDEMARDDVSVCYFFFKDDNAQQSTSSYAFSAIIHQILTDHPALVKHAMIPYHFQGSKFADEFTSLWSILVAITGDPIKGRNVICILDGLDECEKLDRLMLMEHIVKYYNNISQTAQSPRFFLKFLVTSRPNVLNEDIFFDLPEIRLRAEDETIADIELVVKGTISAIGLRRNISIEQQHALVKAIIANADRTFLWVSLVLQRIQNNERFSKEALRELIETLPPDMDGIYDKILSESPRSGHTRKVLRIVVAALRPLSLAEFNIAFVIRSTDKAQQDLDLEPDIESTVKRLCGVFIRVMDSTIYLVHQTAREFLLRPGDVDFDQNGQLPNTDSWKHSLFVENTNEALAEICTWYLSLSDFEDKPLVVDPSTGDAFLKEKVDEYTRGYTLLPYAARFWPEHLRLSKVSQKDPHLDWYLELYDTGSKRFRTWWQIYWVAVYEYSLGPEKITPLILAAYFGQTEMAKKILSASMSGINRLKTLFWRKEHDPINASDDDEKSALSWAAKHGHLDTVRCLFDQWKIDVNWRDSMHMTPLILAAKHGHIEVVKLLLLRKDINADPGDDRWRSALSWAADGYPAIARIFLDRNDVNINSEDRYDCTPLYYAAKSGSLEIVQLLLARPNLEINFNDANASPLAAAILSGVVEISKLFLERAKLSTTGFNLEGALLDAAENGNIQAVQMVLGLDRSLVGCRSVSGRTPLALAAQWGHTEVVRFLLKETDLDINCVDDGQWTPLISAISWFRSTPEIADMLLAREDIIVGHRDKYGQSALSNAAEHGRIAILQSLLKRQDININDRDYKGYTPLIWAAIRGQPESIELLLAQEGVDINAQDYLGKTAVAWAAYNGREESVRILIEQGYADCELSDRAGKTPFMHALRRGRKSAAKLLAGEHLRYYGFVVSRSLVEHRVALSTALTAMGDLFNLDHLDDPFPVDALLSLEDLLDSDD